MPTLPDRIMIPPDVEPRFEIRAAFLPVLPCKPDCWTTMVGAEGLVHGVTCAECMPSPQGCLLTLSG